MLYVIDADNRDRYTDLVEQSYRVRHRVFVEQKGWSELRREDNREIDQFDTDDAIYLVFINDEGGVIGGSRLLPSTKQHLLSDVFPHLATMYPIPRGPDVFEWSRIYVDHSNCPTSLRTTILTKIMCGVQQYCLDHSIAQLTGVAEQRSLPLLMKCKWHPMPLGLPQDIAGEKVIGLKMRVSQEALDKTAQHAHTETTALYRKSGKVVDVTR